MQKSPSCECRPFWYVAFVDAPREAWKCLVNRFRGIRDIDPQEAYQRIQKGAFVLDVRDQSEYDAGHVRGSTLIPLGSLAGRLNELESVRAREVVVICHGGKRSATACGQLNDSGFLQTFNIAGGILAWKRAGLPVEK